MVYKVFDKKTGSGISVNEQLVEELHKAVIKKSKKRKVYTRFKDNIAAADLVEMGSLSSKIKKVKTVLNAFTEIVSESSHKPNKLCVDQGSEFYNKLMQEWLDNNNILIYSTHNEDKSVIAERFIKN